MFKFIKITSVILAALPLFWSGSASANTGFLDGIRPPGTPSFTNDVKVKWQRADNQKNHLRAVMDKTTGEISHLPAQSLVFSAGRFPELIFTRPSDDAADTAWTALPPYKAPANADENGLFAKGDALTDFSGAIKAIGAGRRAAATIHKLIYDIPLDLPKNVLKPEVVVQNVDHVEAVSASHTRLFAFWYS